MERMKVIEYYENPQQFLDELTSINVRKLVNQSDKDLIKKLKKWVKEYWQEDGSMFLYESQYKRLQMILADIID
jgi:hypothetical protein|uniref:Uncharacterized protein n=1 Tax=Myoviridae sp. ctWb16 TaxID=2827690 RepID=A0A8S5T0U7_9CAUD|nr:MAG TPA: hypothetical protein [Myoviridae sp. ctWb16]